MYCDVFANCIPQQEILVNVLCIGTNLHCLLVTVIEFLNFLPDPKYYLDRQSFRLEQSKHDAMMIYMYHSPNLIHEDKVGGIKNELKI